MHLNVEIKAQCHHAGKMRDWLMANKADYNGTDHQTDTYFLVPEGRLKLRQGNIENSLIHYVRNNQAGPKDSHVTMTKVENGTGLHEVLSKALGVLVEVKKSREIYFIENVKFHLDEVPGLGYFVEIEAIDMDGSLGQEYLLRQCEFYMEALGIAESDLQDFSYSDLLLEKQS